METNEFQSRAQARFAAWRCIGVDRLLRAMRGKKAPGHHKLSHGARLAALEIANFDTAYFSVGYLGELLECAESTARGYVAELEAAGLAKRHFRTNVVGGCGTNDYELIVPELCAESRGGPAKDRPHKHEAQGEQPENGEQKEHKAAAAPPEPTGQGGRSADPDAELFEALGATAARLDPEHKGNPAPSKTETIRPTSGQQEQPGAQRDRGVGSWNGQTAASKERERTSSRATEGQPDAQQDQAGARSAASRPRRKHAALRDCRPDMLGPELELALRQVPDGRAAVAMLETRIRAGKLAVGHAIKAAKRAVEYHAKKGVGSAVLFVQHVLADYRHETDLQAEVEAAKRHEDYVEPRPGPRPKKPAARPAWQDVEVPAARRHTSVKGVAPFLRYVPPLDAEQTG